MKQGVHFRNTCQGLEKNRTKALRLFGVCLASHTVILLLAQASFPTRAESSQPPFAADTRKQLLRLEKEVRRQPGRPRLNFTHTGDSGEIRVQLPCRSTAQNHKAPACPLSPSGEPLAIHRTPQTIKQAAWLLPGLQGKRSGERHRLSPNGRQLIGDRKPRLLSTGNTSAAAQTSELQQSWEV